MNRILIIEDDRALNAGIALALRGGDMEFDSAYDLAGAAALLAKNRYDLLLLDVNLPDGSGFDFLLNLRAESDVPVILLTANDLETDIVSGLALGADDYVTKPFSLAVLRARVQVQLRKISAPGSGGAAAGPAAGSVCGADTSSCRPQTAGAVFRFGDYVFDFDQLRFTGPSGSVELSRTEQKLLRILVENRGAVVSRERLLSWIWDDGADFVEENALSVAVKRLRDKLDAADAIRTVYGVGYCWEEKQPAAAKDLTGAAREEDRHD